MAGTVAWVSSDPDWTFREIDAVHTMMLLNPIETADIIWGLINGT